MIHEQDFLRLNEEELCQIFASDELSVSEMELFNVRKFRNLIFYFFMNE